MHLRPRPSGTTRRRRRFPDEELALRGSRRRDLARIEPSVPKTGPPVTHPPVSLGNPGASARRNRTLLGLNPSSPRLHRPDLWPEVRNEWLVEELKAVHYLGEPWKELPRRRRPGVELAVVGRLLSGF